MLIKEKLNQMKFSAAERNIAQYLLDHPYDISQKSLREIAKQTYTSTSVCIHVAEKLGFDKWNDLKEAYLHEQQYLASHFSNIDANIPFLKGDDVLTIANKITLLQQETLADTLSLIQRESLLRACTYIEHAKKIVLFASSNVISLCEEFIYEMNRINRSVEFICSDGEQMFRAYNCDEEDCAIVVSYTGETDIILVISDILKQRRTPIIALTSIGENTLSHCADVTLPISTREKQYSKIASFSINTSIRLQLSILYSCIFSLHYEEHMQYRIENAKRIETPQTRTSHFSLIQENEDETIESTGT